MPSPLQLALTASCAPFVAFALSFLFLRARPRASAFLVVSAGLASAGSAVLLAWNGPLASPLTTRWLNSDGRGIEFGFLLDGPSLLMGMIVAVISACIQIYSLAYMSKDAGRARFFSFLGLFTWAMLSFVYSASLLQAFIFWELVGLASFLLIGFWYEKPSAVAAAKKAFLMTRVGDVGFLIGLILLYLNTGVLDIVRLNSPAVIASIGGDMLTLITLLMFAGIVGKSAQFPLHTWLPDAMEGPTPVSALLHSATMVAAGVFLMARFHPLFLAAPKTMELALVLAAGTALLSSTMAMVARDIKRVLAFSSISQLSFMLMGLASGSLFAGMFHLTTHAIFKALLFLCAGALIHRAGSNDLVTIGRVGSRDDRGPAVALVLGFCALSGLPFFAGFASKESILHSLHGHSAVFAAALLAAFLTAYYSFRVVFLVWRPQPKSAAKGEAPSAAAHPGASPGLMQAPVLLLGLGAVIAGFLGAPIASLLGVAETHVPLTEAAPAILVACAGVFVAWLSFGRAGASQLGIVARIPALQRLFENGWYVDAFYRAVILRGVNMMAGLLFFVETKLLDAGTDRLGQGTLRGGRGAAATQAGRIQVYIGAAVLVFAALSFYLVER